MARNLLTDSSVNGNITLNDEIPASKSGPSMASGLVNTVRVDGDSTQSAEIPPERSGHLNGTQPC